MQVDKERLLKECLNSIFIMDRDIHEVTKLQKQAHESIGIMKLIGVEVDSELMKKAGAMDARIEDLKRQRNFFADILFQTTGAIAVSIWND